MTRQSSVSAWRSESVKVIVTGKSSINLTDLDITEAEYEILARVLKFVRTSKHGKLELSAYTNYVERKGIPGKIAQRVIDIVPMERERVEVNPVSD